MIKPIVLGPLVAAGLALTATAAFPHADFVDNNATAGVNTVFRVSVPHGCGGEATTALRLMIPQEIFNARPQQKEGWELEVVRAPLDAPFTNSSGNEVTDYVSEVSWTGNLSDEYYEEFLVRLNLPDMPGETLPVKIVHECGGEIIENDREIILGS